MKSPVRKYFFVITFILVTVFINAQQIVVSVSDFSVESANKQYTYIGKGISTLVAGELRKTKAVKLLERSKMNKILEEQKLSLTGLVDENSQVELGKLLAADYIIFGEIIDMGNSLLVSARMADVTTSEVVWEDSLTEKLETYDFIGAYFARSILTELNLNVTEEITAKVENKVEKEPEAIVALSNGVDAYDKGDEEKAKEELKAVQKLDPGNEVAEFYLSKLQAISPKFRVELQEYSPAYSPASLGFIDKDRIYLWTGIPFTPPGVELTAGGSQVIGVYSAKDWQIDSRLGYSFPVGEKMGLTVGVVSGGQDNKVYLTDNSPVLSFGTDTVSGMQSFLMNLGGEFGLGVRLLDSLGFGTSVLVWNAAAGEGSSNIVREGVFFSIYPGLLFRDPNGTFTFDINTAYSNQKIYYADYNAGKIVLGSMPLVIDSSFTFSVLNQRLFLGLKGISDIYLDDRGGYLLRIIPMAEFWPFRFLSLRGGYEYSHLDQSGTFTIGQGAVGGFTIKLGKFDINANLTYRKKPARLLPGVTVANLKLLIGLEYNPGFLTR